MKNHYKYTRTVHAKPDEYIRVRRDSNTSSGGSGGDAGSDFGAIFGVIVAVLFFVFLEEIIFLTIAYFCLRWLLDHWEFVQDKILAPLFKMTAELVRVVSKICVIGSLLVLRFVLKTIRAVIVKIQVWQFMRRYKKNINQKLLPGIVEPTQLETRRDSYLVDGWESLKTEHPTRISWTGGKA